MMSEGMILLHILCFLCWGLLPFVFGQPRCSHSCLDAKDCWEAGCHYDYTTLHCFPSEDEAIAGRPHIRYKRYIREEDTVCINSGGNKHTDVNGYRYASDTAFRLGQNVKNYGNVPIKNVAPADGPLYQTERSGGRINYLVQFIGAKQDYSHNWILRLHFAELSNSNRNFDIVLNGLIYLKRGFNIRKSVGFQTGVVYDYPIHIANGILSVWGQSTLMPFEYAPLGINAAFFSFTQAKLSALCCTRFPPCTTWCHDIPTCNRQPNCYYDYYVNHCLEKDLNLPSACIRNHDNKPKCIGQGCEYCCLDDSCRSTPLPLNCNYECSQYCQDRPGCLSHGCDYENATRHCEEQGPDCGALLDPINDDYQNCLDCTSGGCEFSPGSNPPMCVRPGHNGPGPGYYTTPEQCRKDCDIHLGPENESSRCLGCTRDGAECAYVYPKCEEPREKGRCVSHATYRPPQDPSMRPGHAWNQTECMENCPSFDGMAGLCRNAGCNYCCSNNKCYAGRMHESECPTGCASNCHDEFGCVAYGCHFDMSTGECVDRRTACARLHGNRKVCEAMGCQYCCNLQACLPTNLTEADKTPDNPPHRDTIVGCCEGSPDRFYTACHERMGSQTETGMMLCAEQEGATYTGIVVQGQCALREFQYQCSRNHVFWTGCRSAWRSLRGSGMEVCGSVGSSFANAYSSSTCTDGKVRFLCSQTPEETLSVNAMNDMMGDIAGMSSSRKRNAASLRTSSKCHVSCEDAAECKANGCYYDYGQLHCFDSEEEAKSLTILHEGYSAVDVSICKNSGGAEHADVDGYVFTDDSLPHAGYKHNVTDFGSSAVIDGADPRDWYIYQTERSGSSMMYNIHFAGGDGHYQIRVHFVELTHREEGKRQINIVLGRTLFLRRALDLYKEVGFGKALVLDFAVTVANGMLHYNTEEVRLRNGRVGLEIKAVLHSWTIAKSSGFCVFTHYVCTHSCKSGKACEETPDCYFDKTINHCVHISNKPMTCARLNGTKQACLEQGCEYCCLTHTCHAEIPTGDEECNAACGAYCQEPDKCGQNGCEYNEETDMCEELKINCTAIVSRNETNYKNCLICAGSGKCEFDPDTGTCARIPKGADAMAPPGHFTVPDECEEECHLSNQQHGECDERGCKFCCETKGCYRQDAVGWTCETGCSKYCDDPANCTLTGCFYDPDSGDCNDLPPEHPCTACETTDCGIPPAIPTLPEDDTCTTCCNRFDSEPEQCMEVGCQSCRCPTSRCIPKEEDCYPDDPCVSFCDDPEGCSALTEPLCVFNESIGTCAKKGCEEEEGGCDADNDLVFIFDSSSSINRTQGLYDYMRKFTAEFVKAWKRNPGSRVAIYLFSQANQSPVLYVPITNTLSESEIHAQALDTPFLAKGSFMANCIAASVDHLNANIGLNSKRNIVVLSDGDAADRYRLPAVVEAATSSGIDLWFLALTMTSEYNKGAIDTVVSDREDHIQYVNSLGDDAKLHARELEEKICEAEPIPPAPPTEPPPPTTLPTTTTEVPAGCDADNDLVFIFDSSRSIEDTEGLYDYMKIFTANFARAWKQNPGSRVAIYLFSGKDATNVLYVPLTNALSESEIYQKALDTTFLKQNSFMASCIVESVGHLNSNIGLNTKRNIVILSDGDATDADQLEDATRVATASGIGIFFLALKMGAKYSQENIDTVVSHQGDHIQYVNSLQDDANAHAAELQRKICESMDLLPPTMEPPPEPTFPPTLPPTEEPPTEDPCPPTEAPGIPTTEEPARLPPPIPTMFSGGCDNNNDLMFILDSSASIKDTPQLYDYMKMFTAEFTRAWRHNPENRVGIYLFSPISSAGQLYLTIANELSDQEAYRRAKLAPYLDLESFMAGCILLAVEHLNAFPGTNTKRNIVILSDGDATDAEKLDGAAAVARASGVGIYFLALTMGVEYSEENILKAVAGQRDHIQYVQSVEEDPKEHAMVLEKKICEAAPIPPIPITTPDYEDYDYGGTI